MAEGQWIRLQVDWQSSKWLEDLPWEVRAVWPVFLCHVKLYGNGRGQCKAISLKAFARIHDIPLRTVEECYEQAVTVQAMCERDGKWEVAQWKEYQSPDAQRMKKLRQAQSANLNVTDNCHLSEPLSRDDDGDVDDDNKSLAPKPVKPPRKPVSVRKSIPESETEVLEEFQRRGYPQVQAAQLAEQFMAHYQAVGWVYGKNPKPVRDWKACVTTWKSHHPISNGQARPRRTDEEIARLTA